MVRKYWLAVTFAAGIALGFLFGHSSEVERPVERIGAGDPPLAPTPAPAMAPAPASRRADLPPARPVAPPAEPPRRAAGPPASISFAVENAEPERFDYDNYSGYSLPVDAGPNFGAQIADSIRNGRRDSLAQEHVQLERELRDDSWSYPLEAELQNMLAADPVMGKFKVEHLECRATRCELRVSGKVRMEQESGINQWLSNMHRIAWPGDVRVGTAVFSGTEDGSEGMLMLHRPPAKN